MYTGITAKLTMKNNAVAYITNWSVENTCETIELTMLGSEDKEVLPSFTDWSASAEGYASFTGIQSSDVLYEAMENGVPVKFEFALETERVNDVEKVKTGFSGYALIESLSLKASAGEYPTVSISIVGVQPLEFIENVTV